MKKLIRLLIVVSILLITSSIFAQNNNDYDSLRVEKLLNVIGKSELKGHVKIDSTVTIEKNLAVKDSVRIEKDLRVIGDTKMEGDLIIEGKTEIKDDIEVSGVTLLKDKLIVYDKTEMKDKLIVYDKTEMKDDATVEGDFKIKSLADSTATLDRYVVLKSTGKLVSGGPIYPDPQPGDFECGFPSDATFANNIWLFRPNNILFVDCIIGLGLGTPYPNAKLDVRGSGLFSQKLGIGNITTPEARLHVAGDVRIEDLAGSGTRMVVTDEEGNLSAENLYFASDNLGNHTATQNLKLNSFWLSGDGEDEGILVDGDGNVQIGTYNSPSLLKVYNSIVLGETTGSFYNTIRNENSEGILQIFGGTNSSNSASITLYGSDAGAIEPGSIHIRSGGYPGILIYNNKFDVYENTEFFRDVNIKEYLSVEKLLYVEMSGVFGSSMDQTTGDAFVIWPHSHQFTNLMFYSDAVRFINGNLEEIIRFQENGDVYMEKDLYVCGTIWSKEWIVDPDWCDFVFEKNYKRMSWQEKEKFYIKNKHLPGIDPGKKIEKEGLRVSKNIVGITQNVEENRLDITDLFKRVENLEKSDKEKDEEIKKLKKSNAEKDMEIENLKNEKKKLKKK